MAASLALLANVGFASRPGPVGPNPCEDAPLAAALPDLPCDDAALQSPVNFSAPGLGVSALQAIRPNQVPEAACTVNVHWHSGAEHYSAGEYDVPFKTWLKEAKDKKREAGLADELGLVGGGGKEIGDSIGGVANVPHRSLSAEKEHLVGYFCPDYDASDSMYTTSYAWEHCHDMEVGLTYEIHWPHSTLGKCGSMWQYQEPFTDGVFCKATEANLTLDVAVNALLTSAEYIGVYAQVFQVVNPPEGDTRYDYPEWDMLKGWNTALAKKITSYIGSTTGPIATDGYCRGTGGVVNWHVDNGCQKVSAKAFDNLCKQLQLATYDDMYIDQGPHGSRDPADIPLVLDDESPLKTKPEKP